ncbi:MAG: hypothetical protein GY818_22525, partial [Planctomycetaceae bacterium]|nr:hypothetical protein [Planctomycetaceae bacterium]
MKRISPQIKTISGCTETESADDWLQQDTNTNYREDSDNDWNPTPWNYDFSEKRSNSSVSLDRTMPESRSNYPLAAPKPDKPFLTRPVHNAEA